MKKVKISTRQLMIIFIVMIYSPSERFLSKYLSSKALQAGWISPIITALLFVVFMYIISFLLKKYKSIGFAGIILRVLGPFYGRVLLLFYLVWITFLNSFYLRFYGERLITSIYSNTNMSIFIIIMLIVITIVIKKGIVIVTRMAEIIFYISTFFFVVLFFVTLPTIEIELLTPISRLDVYPIMEGSIGVLGIFYLGFLLFFYDDVLEEDNFMKEVVKTSLFLLCFMTILVVSSIGILGVEMLDRTSISYFTVISNVKILGNISGLESILILNWIFTDFIFITMFIYVAMKLIQYIFNKKHWNCFINIYAFILYLLCKYIVSNHIELEYLSEQFIIYTNIILLFGIPIILVVIDRFLSFDKT